MHFACLHTCWKKDQVQIVFACSKGFEAFSLKCLFAFSFLAHCTVFENQLKCLIHLSIDFNAKDLCGKTPFMNACFDGHKDVAKLSLARNILKKWDFFEWLSNTVQHYYRRHPVVFDLNFKTIEHDFVENRLAHYLLDYSLSFCASKVSTRKIGLQGKLLKGTWQVISTNFPNFAQHPHFSLKLAPPLK